MEKDLLWWKVNDEKLKIIDEGKVNFDNLYYLKDHQHPFSLGFWLLVWQL